MAKGRALAQRPRAPGQLAGRDGQFLVDPGSQRGDDAGRAVAPQHAYEAVALRVESRPSQGRPVDEAVLLNGKPPKRFAHVVKAAERQHAAREAVRRPEALVDPAVESLRPETIFVTLPLKPLDARGHV